VSIKIKAYGGFAQSEVIEKKIAKTRSATSVSQNSLAKKKLF
jgi:hypothetical protein